MFFGFLDFIFISIVELVQYNKLGRKEKPINYHSMLYTWIYTKAVLISYLSSNVETVVLSLGICTNKDDFNKRIDSKFYMV